MTSPLIPDGEDFVRVEWQGPFAWGPDGLMGGLLDPLATDEALDGLLDQAGIYMILGDHPVHGERALLYIGETIRFSRRILNEHEKWIANEWRVSIYLGLPTPAARRKEVEAFLIYAHSPAYNWRSKGGPPAKPLRIWSTGRFHRILPEISSLHPWYANARDCL